MTDLPQTHSPELQLFMARAELDRIRAVNAELVAALTMAAEGLNSITDNAPEWSINQTRDHAQQVRVVIDEALATAEQVQP